MAGVAPAAWIGGAVGLAGVAVLAGFALHIPWLLQLRPGRDAAMSLESGASLLLAGLLLVVVSLGRRAPRTAAGLGLLLLGLNLAVLAENLLDKDFGLDQPQRYAWLTDTALRPGRMAPNTAFAYALFALAVLLLPRIQTRRGAVLMGGLTMAIVVVAASGLAGYFVHIEALYTYHGMAAMAPYSACALLVLALGLWLAWRGKRWNRPAADAAHGVRLISVAAVVVIAVVAVAAVVNFALLWHLQQRAAITNLSLRRDERSNQVRELIESARARGRLFALEQSQRWPGAAASAGASGRLPPEAGFSSTELLDTQGRVLARSGRAAAEATLTLPLSPRAALLWSQGPVLRQRLPVARHGKALGEAIVEQQLPLLASVGMETASWGQTGEMALCGRTAAGSQWIQCLPMRSRPYPFAISPFIHGQELPMQHALAGDTGVIQALDYRGERTLAAYAPIPGLHLGLVLKMDTTEIYAAVRRQIELMAPLLLALTLMALEILRWQMRPLVQELVESRNRAMNSEARFRAAAESSQDAFYIFECEREPGQGAIRDFRVVYINQPGEALAACLPGQPGCARLSDCPHLAKVERLQATLRRVVETRQAVNEEFALPDGPGLPKWLHHQAVPLGDGVAVTLRDISERKWEQERLISLAETDSLTGLANRSAFRKRLLHAMEASRRLRQQALLALLYLDIDYFKQINDSLGHAQGDRLLQAFATRLRSCVRSLDSVARLGGDEFTILLENLDGAADAERVVAAIYAALRQPFRLDGNMALVTASIGVAFYHGEEIAPDELLRRADTALYQAKRNGRNIFRVFAA
ncbi:MAG TPA: diguanylate cyclase [Terriglobales bacterium]|nr:diguanylate cyclase [Terriglobales bacterium]